jgi:hypothetical protein
LFTSNLRPQDFKGGIACLFIALHEHQVSLAYVLHDLNQVQFRFEGAVGGNLIRGGDDHMHTPRPGMSPTILPLLIHFKTRVGMLLDRGNSIARRLSSGISASIRVVFPEPDLPMSVITGIAMLPSFKYCQSFWT